MLSTKLTVCLGLLFVINIEAAPAPEPWHLPNLPPLYPPQPPMYPPQPPIYRPQPPMGSIFDLFDDLFKPWGMSSSGNQGGYPWTMLNRAESGQWDDQIIEECNPS